MAQIRLSTALPAALLAVIVAGAVWLWVRPERSDAPAIAMCGQLYRKATLTPTRCESTTRSRSSERRAISIHLRAAPYGPTIPGDLAVTIDGGGRCLTSA